MVDIDTHRVIDLLDSREIDTVAEWLKTYPRLEIVSRDGSVSYNSAIKQANKDIVQISDRRKARHYIPYGQEVSLPGIQSSAWAL